MNTKYLLLSIMALAAVAPRIVCMDRGIDYSHYNESFEASSKLTIEYRNSDATLQALHDAIAKGDSEKIAQCIKDMSAHVNQLGAKTYKYCYLANAWTHIYDLHQFKSLLTPLQKYVALRQAEELFRGTFEQPVLDKILQTYNVNALIEKAFQQNDSAGLMLVLDYCTEQVRIDVSGKLRLIV